MEKTKVRPPVRSSDLRRGSGQWRRCGGDRGRGEEEPSAGSREEKEEPGAGARAKDKELAVSALVEEKGGAAADERW